MKIWIDITNTPHVNVLLPIIKHLEQKHEIIITARNFSETIPLLKSKGLNALEIGNYKGKNRIRKIIGLMSRVFQLNKKVPDFDISLSLGGNSTSSVSFLRKKPSIVFSDNDISFKRFAFKYGTDFIFPKYFNSDKIEKKYQIKPNSIKKFNGFKEDIYIANYIPNKEFLKEIPFDNFICIRPENLKASYIPKNSVTIVPQLFKIFKNENILFLPRYPEERKYAKEYSNIFIPDNVLSGLDVCFYAKAVLTGAGTFAREAALLGTPAVSFFPGKTFLTVDKIMQEKGIEFKSRNPQEIKEYVNCTPKRKSEIKQSKVVFQEVISIFEGIIDKHM
jgi:uncharacterized protein